MAKAKVTPWPIAAEREVERLNERVDVLDRAARRVREFMVDLAGRDIGNVMDRMGTTPEWDATFRELTYAIYPHLKPAERAKPTTEVVEVPPPPEVVSYDDDDEPPTVLAAHVDDRR